MGSITIAYTIVLFLIATMQLTIIELFAQTGSLSTLTNSNVDYAVSIIPEQPK